MTKKPFPRRPSGPFRGGRLRQVTAIGLVLSTLAACRGPQEAKRAPDPKVRITLQRSACFGSCPDYKVVIDGLGRVLFTTDTRPVDAVSGVHRAYSRSIGVLLPGTHRARIDPNEVQKLLDRASAADFFALKPVYRANMTDAPSYVVTIDTGKTVKTVVDYVGLQAGMPRAVTDLEDAIDATAGTKRWIEGTPDAIAALQAEKADLSGWEGAALMTAAAVRDDVATMRRLRALGAPSRFEGYDPLPFAAGNKAFAAARFLIAQGAANDRASFLQAVHAAIVDNDGVMVRLLLDAGARKLIGKQEATDMLPAAAGHGNFSIAKMLLDAGADVRGPAERRQYDEPPIFAAARGELADDKGPEVEARRKLVELLLAHGSDIHQCAMGCESVLLFVRDPVIARTLVRAGADPNEKDQDGEPVIFSIGDEDVALELIASGARLDAMRPGDGMTLRGWATYQKWPRVLAMLKGR